MRYGRYLRAGIPVILAVTLAAVSAVDGSQPFNPSLDVSLGDPAPAANSDVMTVISVPSGNHSISTWDLLTPVGWKVASGKRVPAGDVVARGTMSVDLDCTGSIEQFGPFELTNVTPDHGLVADWQGQIASFWLLSVSVFKAGKAFEMSTFLTDLTEPHTICAPQTFSLTILGRSVPGNAEVISNPRSPGTYTWRGSYLSDNGEHQAIATDAVCVGTCP